MHEQTIRRFNQLKRRDVPLHEIEDRMDELERYKSSLEADAELIQKLGDVADEALERVVRGGR
jgi:hypothetical protein